MYPLEMVRSAIKVIKGFILFYASVLGSIREMKAEGCSAESLQLS
jgi:hypothetical protein